jgi:hypothetical protein
MELGKVLIIVGGALLALGIVLVFLPKEIHPLAWFGKLPGDISYSNNGTSIFIPITSMIIVSVVLSMALGLLRWLSPPR